MKPQDSQTDPAVELCFRTREKFPHCSPPTPASFGQTKQSSINPNRHKATPYTPPGGGQSQSVSQSVCLSRLKSQIRKTSYFATSVSLPIESSLQWVCFREEEEPRAGGGGAHRTSTRQSTSGCSRGGRLHPLLLAALHSQLPTRWVSEALGRGAITALTSSCKLI